MDLLGVAHPVLVDEQLAGADADHHVVRLVILAIQEMDVVGRHRLQSELLPELQQARHHVELLLESVIVDFDVGVLLAEDLRQLRHRLAGLVEITGEQPFVDRAGDAAGQADDALVKLAQRRPVDPRLAVVETLQVTLGHQLLQVGPALFGLGQQGQVGGAPATGDLLLVRHVAGGEVDFAAEDRLHALRRAGLEEFHRPEEVAVIGHRDRRHPQLPGPPGELLAAVHAVEQRVFGMDVEVDEGVGHRVPPTLAIRGRQRKAAGSWRRNFRGFRGILLPRLQPRHLPAHFAVVCRSLKKRGRFAFAFPGKMGILHP
jgi:hypothetical protein